MLSAGAMKVLTYSGQGQPVAGATDASVVTPADLASADVVLTTYEVIVTLHIPLRNSYLKPGPSQLDLQRLPQSAVICTLRCTHDSPLTGCTTM